MKFLSLSINGTEILAPSGVPTGGLSGAGGNAINLAIQLIFVVGIVFTIVFVLLSGIQWIISGGDKEKIQKAKGRLTYSIIGLIVIISAFFIVSVIIYLLGVPLAFF